MAFVRHFTRHHRRDFYSFLSLHIHYHFRLRSYISISVFHSSMRGESMFLVKNRWYSCCVTNTAMFPKISFLFDSEELPTDAEKTNQFPRQGDEKNFDTYMFVSTFRGTKAWLVTSEGDSPTATCFTICDAFPVRRHHSVLHFRGIPGKMARN